MRIRLVHYHILMFICLFLALYHTAEAKIFLPNATGLYNDTSWSGTYTDVDEYLPHDADTAVNSTTTINAIRSYNLENSSDSGTITNLRVVVVAKSVTQTEALRLFIRTNGVDNFKVAQNLTTSYATYTGDWTTNPGGGSWTTSDITSIEAGFQVIDDTGTVGFSGTHNITQLYLDVTFKTETNKTKYHILQNTGGFAPADPQIDTLFTVGIADPLDDIKTAFIEMKGVANTGSATLRVSLDDGNPIPTCNTSRAKCYVINSTGRPVSFRILYDVTDYFKSTIRTSGTPSFTLNLKNDGPQALNIASGKLTVTYTWIVPPAVTGAYAVSGTLMSSTFDTGAVNGASFHSLGYVGVLNSGKVRFRIAASSVSTGPWTDTDFYGEAGGSCTNTNWYEPTVNTTFPLTNVTPITSCHAQLNNKRYFRYLTQLCSLDCAGSSAFTPEVRDIIINWSP